MKQYLNKNKESKNKKTFKKTTIVAIFFIVLFLVILAILIAYVADFIRFNGTLKNGLLWTVDQRKHGLFNFWNK
ncbi:hypothetical protein [Metamycoplasma canadense]|uniref:hypothetical protein n=1 Tax=Metamycoplasma canadense TaxID=29554 RepID=UPI0005F08EC5|nr:hypothetical protein [Metamycoplasma canadense]